MSFIDTTVSSNTDIASSYVAGYTNENRQLKVIKLKAPNASTSKAIWIGMRERSDLIWFDSIWLLSSIYNLDCGIHAVG